ncbi:hypothetical protein OOT46_17645 [Aquabacterium sp. A7-Y]|uniref:hypothetical protein n=1 Tax=Aquabacterium sp. A7-Y TaxID=1349605 RepID=UPI00223CEAB1|nr:hypothetical protein [Aquabacterium sp. A7-Y]MCW7539666.1 hypothetical protein [Aquabacterium sp. A7-Y]
MCGCRAAGHSPSRELDNTGSLEAIRARLVVWGALAQLRHTDAGGGVFGTELTGGSLIADHSTIMLNVGEPLAGNAAWRPRLWRNRGVLMLKGDDARLTTSWLGGEVDLLYCRLENAGRLSVLEGA